jgi:serine carboxypeptidase-like clade 2
LNTQKNPYAWNLNANILFLESPPGVGFSINKDPKYIFSDPQTAQDNLKALTEWFKRFPEFSKNKFWIAGESYAGMYIPLLSEQILKHKDEIIPGQKINFQGFMIGNGVMKMDNFYWRG